MLRTGPMLAALAAALAACGDSLVDHRATGIAQGPGGFACDTQTQVACRIDGQDVCKQESVDFCGTSCAKCTAAPAGAVPACLGTPGAGLCDYECTGGLLKCTAGCCQATSVAAGALHSCAIAAAGALYCWGENASGQVTGTSSGIVSTPRKLFESGIVAVAAGEAHTCAASASEVRCWGRSNEGQAPPANALAGVTALAAGYRHTCALAGGAVTCWGSFGAGNGSPVASGATAISAGQDHTCAMLSDHTVRCWGVGTAGQLGDGLATSSSSAVTPTGLSPIAALAAGGGHACAAAISPSGGNINDALECWGDEPGATFGLPSPQKSPATPLKDISTSVVRFTVASLATGRTHTCVEKAGEGYQCFGPENAAGQLGGTPPGTTELAPVPGTVGAKSLAAGGDHACAVFADGSVHCWGSNAHGELGDGSLVTPGVAPDTRILGTPVAVSGR